MPRVNPEQFKAQRAAMLKDQRAVDAEWAQGEWEKLGGDKKAYNFKPDFEGQSYEQQRYGAKPVK
jgi:hypothetical protein